MTFEGMETCYWEPWQEWCKITKEQLEKLKTKHTHYQIESIGEVEDTYIHMKYRITFFQKEKKVDTVEYQAFCLDVKKDWTLYRGIIANLMILHELINKIDQYRNDGRRMDKPTYEQFMKIYEGLVHKAERRMKKGEN